VARIYEPAASLDPLIVGAVAGLAGAAAGLAVLVALAATAGSAVVPVNAIGAWLVRWLQTADPSALTRLYPDATAAGVITAGGVGVVVGAFFAAVMNRLPQDHPVAWGVMMGLVIWVATWFKLLPALDPVMPRAVDRWYWLAALVVFGLITGAWIQSDRGVRRSVPGRVGEDAA
jgi:hypothetical protein